jgi:uncharacterized protein (TIGR03382 family)
MKNLTANVFILVSCAGIAHAQTVLSGYDTAFSYAGFGDITLEQNQDRMTDLVWITRGTTRGIFNFAQEPSFTGQGAPSPSPVGTAWAFGTTSDFDTLTYGTWGSLHSGNPSTLIGQDVVVHLVDDDIYIDLRFTNWGGRTSGGAFSYVRSTIPTPGTLALLSFGSLAGLRRRRC